MKKLCLSGVFCVAVLVGNSQVLAVKLGEAFNKFLSDPQMKHAIAAITVIDASTGTIIYDKNGSVGLAPASTQKVITSITAFEKLGAEFRYTTSFYAGQQKLYVRGSGDPSLGSARWKESSEEAVLTALETGFTKKNIKRPYFETIEFVNETYSNKAFPDGWIWQDIGNYYGAAHSFINWNENSFEIRFNPGSKQGDKIESVALHPSYLSLKADITELNTGARGSGDSAYIYIVPNRDNRLFVTGTVPAGEKNFSIRGGHPSPPDYLASAIYDRFLKVQQSPGRAIDRPVLKTMPAGAEVVFDHQSPIFDSLNFWFMRRSINLFGEAFLRTIAWKESGFGSSEAGVEIIRNFWKVRGIDKESLHILDGSGLSPQNRITTESLTRILQYAQDKKWYKSFYASLPTINAMKMKSGSILGARSYAGYHTSKSGKQYIFAIIVNNYNGSGQSVSRNMFRVLDVLK